MGSKEQRRESSWQRRESSKEQIVGSKEQRRESSKEQIVGSKDQIEAEAEQIVAEMVTGGLGGADRSRDGHR